MLLLVHLFYLWKKEQHFSPHFDRRRPSAVGRHWATGFWSGWCRFQWNLGACATWIWNDRVWSPQFFSEDVPADIGSAKLDGVHRTSLWKTGAPAVILTQRQRTNPDHICQAFSEEGFLRIGRQNWDWPLPGTQMSSYAIMQRDPLKRKKAKKSSKNDCLKWFIGANITKSDADVKLWLIMLITYDDVILR